MAKKKINEAQVLSELSASRFFQPSEPDDDDSTAQQNDRSLDDSLVDKPVDNDVDKQVDQSVDSEVSRPVDQSTDKTTGRQTKRHAGQTNSSLDSRRSNQHTNKSATSKVRQQRSVPFDNSPVMLRPKSFYITKQQDANLDYIARRIAENLEGKIAHRIDRSDALRLILESNDWTSDEAIDELAKHLVNKLISQLVD